MNRPHTLARATLPTRPKPERAAAPPNVGTVVDGRFEIVRRIGEGGASHVFAAEHLVLGHEVALKCLKLDARSPQRMTRVRREARAALVLRYSPHVATVHDVGLLPSGAPYLVMELLEGCDLAAHQAAIGRFAVEDAVDIAIQVCAALADAHRVGLVHRDVKPSNVFLSGHRERLHVRLLDFGVCKFVRMEGVQLEESVTVDSAFLGSPHFMAPEQIRSARRVDWRADLWSVGVLLHRMLAGSYPFDGENAVAICASIFSTEPIALRARRSDAPAELERIVAHALTREVDRRVQSAAMLAGALAPFGSALGRAAAERAQGPRAL